MKKFIVILGALALLSGCAGMKPISEEDKIVERVVVIEGVSQEVAFEGVKVWIAENFTSAKAVLEYEDKDSGRIIGNGKTNYPCSGMECMGKGDWNIDFTMRVDIKEGKFRISFTNVMISWPATSDSLGYHSASRVPVRTKGDMESIRHVLLAYGDSIKNSITSPKNSKDW